MTGKALSGVIMHVQVRGRGRILGLLLFLVQTLYEDVCTLDMSGQRMDRISMGIEYI